MTQARLGLLAVLAVAAAAAWPMQGGGSLQNAHYALVRALASGDLAIDAALGEVGATNDVARVDGRTYSNKPPGLAFATVPAFVVLDAGGVVDETRVLWVLGLVGSVLPAVALAALVWRLGDDVESGAGAAAAVAVALGTLLLPYATLFVHHSLAAFLVFASFALLWRERAAAPRVPLVLAAGALAGGAVVVEYASAVAAAVLTAYVAARRPRARRLAAWAVGAAAGAVPLALYNVAAFGSAVQTSYSVDPSGRGSDLFGRPSLDVALELLLSSHGLFVLSPILVVGAFGLWRLGVRGRRAEALVCGGVALAYLVFNSAFYSPFGGFSPGPRYLIAAGAFLAVGVAPAVRDAPLVTAGLGSASVAAMAMLTATHPLAGYDWRWLERLREGEVPLTAASLAGVTGSVAIVPLFVAGAAAVALAALAARPVHVAPLEPLAAGAALLAWAAVAAAAPEPGRVGDYGAYLPALLVLAAAAALAVVRARPPAPMRARTAPR